MVPARRPGRSTGRPRTACRRCGTPWSTGATSTGPRCATATTRRSCWTCGGPPNLPAEPAPVLLFVPGGAWVHGSRILQGYALLSHLAEQGWVCLSIDYRVAPHHRWPRHITDVKAAIAWARANVDKFGGDRNFVAVAGCSAGGHLAALGRPHPERS